MTETVTHTTTGLRALVPTATVAALRAKGATGVEALDTLVADAHNDHPVARAVCKATGVTALPRLSVVPDTKPGRCTAHPAYEADYCPLCGTATVIGGRA